MHMILMCQGCWKDCGLKSRLGFRISEQGSTLSIFDIVTASSQSGDQGEIINHIKH